VPSKAEVLLENMRRSTTNWKRRDLDNLYLGFGFSIKNGAKHDVAKHKVYPQLRATLPRHSYLAKGYITFAVKLIEQLQELERQGEE